MNSTYGVDECADVCTSPNVTSLGTLSGCTLTFKATTANAWYAIALQVNILKKTSIFYFRCSKNNDIFFFIA